jgi:hypothetical protein
VRDSNWQQCISASRNSSRDDTIGVGVLKRLVGQ